MTRDSHPLPAPPSWPKVIATTLRLWVQRHVLPARPQAAASKRRYQTGALLVAIVVVAVGIASVAISLHNAGAQSPSPARHAARPAKAATHSAAPLSSAALASADASRQQAASWVAAQVSQGIIVACDPLMCSALQQHGFPAADLATLGGAASDPMGSGIVMSTLAVRAQLGSELTRVYAPVVIASFGSGLSLVQVRVTAPGGAAAYLSAEHADLQARQVAGRTLAGNRNIRAPAAARAQLAAGQVDMRLMIILATLTHKVSSIQIRSFADAGLGRIERSAADGNCHHAIEDVPHSAALVPARAAAAPAPGHLAAPSRPDDHGADPIQGAKPYRTAQHGRYSMTALPAAEHRPHPRL